MSKRSSRSSLKSPLSKETQNLIRYWRHSILEGERAQVAGSDIAGLGVDLPMADLRSGRTTSAVVRQLQEKRESYNRTNKRKRDSTDAERQSVLICPISFSRTRSAPDGPPYLELLWIPALLDVNGTLKPIASELPWIPRGVLEPLVTDSSISIGRLKAAESFAEKKLPPHWQSWEDLLRFCQRWVSHVAREDFESIEIEYYRRRPHALVLPFSQSQRQTSPLVRLFDSVLHNKRSPGLLAQVATIAEPGRKPFSRSARALRKAAIRHTGQFGDQFPLAPTQRLAVHRMLETGNDDFLCVTGPPGTGKTTFLQSIIASLWVNAVSSSNTAPPVIVACGATNQSVMNVIDSFEKTSSTLGMLSRRWLPGVTSYGTFCCSATRAAELTGYQLELRDGTGLSSQMEQFEYVQRAERFFLEHYTTEFGTKTTLAKAARSLAAAVAEERGGIYRAVQASCGGSLVEMVQRLLGTGPAFSYWDSFQALDDLDVTRRHRAFLLATHYWEARWLLTIGKHLATSPQGTSSKRLASTRADWQRRAMVTPVFVSTLSMAPGYFADKHAAATPPVDLLIFDEAGQVPVEIGTALLALSRRGLFVGDTMQLEPLWNIPPHLDRKQLEQFGLLASRSQKDGFSALAKRGVAASGGSLMHLALRSSKRIEDTTLGVFLSEHRRSVPKIVQFCNTLAYNNRLKPKRPEPAEQPLPAFGYIRVTGIAEKQGTSRLNRSEAAAINQWLEVNQQRLIEHYQLPLDQIVAVLTPFAAQVRQLKKTLSKYPKLTIGTVSALQGAERPVVLFSSVYDAKYRGPLFFDRSSTMLNVAVSRAKDSFIAVGDMDVFESEGSAPSNVLARFLLEEPTNELSLPQPESKPELLPEVLPMLATLEQHREAFHQALHTSREELIIVSPFISQFAVEHDRIPDLLAATLKRGVRVRVFTSSGDVDSEGKLRQRTIVGREMIVNSGAELLIAHNIHNKSLMIDRHTLIDGSFNWLSATRHASRGHQNLEVSRGSRGPNTAKEIEHLLAALDYRCRIHLGEVSVQRSLVDEDEL